MIRAERQNRENGDFYKQIRQIFFCQNQLPTRFIGFCNDTKFYLFTRQNIPSTINNSSLSVSLQKCSPRRSLNFRLPCHSDIYAKLRISSRNETQPEILGTRTSWQTEGFFNLQILQVHGPKLIRKHAWKSCNFLSETRECTLT